MNKQELFTRIDKIFRANTIEKQVVTGQFDQTTTVKVIEDIGELKQDIKDLIKDQFHVGTIDKRDVFDGGRKLGESYHISEPIKIAKEWGYKYVLFNDQIFELVGKDEIKNTGLSWEDL